MPSPTDRGPAARRYRCARGHFLPANFQPPATDPDDWDDECRCKPQTISIKEPTVTGRQIALDTQPRRIQRRRTKGWRAPAGAVYVGRPTRFGNPARLIRTDRGPRIQWGGTGTVAGWPANGQSARGYATELYRTWITRPEQADTLSLFRALLHGRDLTCWCPLDEPCHADVLLEIANAE